MTSPAETDAAPPAGRDEKHGRGLGIAAAVVPVVAMAALFVLPGFVAAGISRMESTCLGMDGVACWEKCRFEPGWPRRESAEFAILVPSGWLMARSESIREFYSWEYRVAGGQSYITRLEAIK